MHVQDGYKLIRANQLLSAMAAANEGRISFRALRVYTACLELVAIREAAARCTIKRRKPLAQRFFASEISALMGYDSPTSVSRELAALKKNHILVFSTNVISFSENTATDEYVRTLIGTRGVNRLVPIPRKMLRFLAECSKPAMFKTVIAYLLRGLSLDRSGLIRSAGTAKISWICKLCRISERAARAARAELIRLGWISKDTGSFQRKLNRDGAYFVIDTAWRRAFKRSAPPTVAKCPESAPLLKRTETPSELKNRKLGKQRQSGFFEAGREQKPDLRNVQPEDIRKPSRLRTLFEEAVKAGWLDRSEASLLNFAGAAVRANRAAGDPVRIFLGIVRKGLWHHISADEEERGRKILQKVDAGQRNTPILCPPSSSNVSDCTEVREQGERGLTCVRDLLPTAVLVFEPTKPKLS